MLASVSEIVLSVGRNVKARSRLLFIAMYRDNEVTLDHPLATEIKTLRESMNVELTEINLMSLSRGELESCAKNCVPCPHLSLRPDLKLTLSTC